MVDAEIYEIGPRDGLENEPAAEAQRPQGSTAAATSGSPTPRIMRGSIHIVA